MGCCGSTTKLGSQAARFQGPPSVTGYALDLPDKRVLTYLTRQEADAARESLGVQTPVREVLGWR